MMNIVKENQKPEFVSSLRHDIECLKREVNYERVRSHHLYYSIGTSRKFNKCSQGLGRSTEARGITHYPRANGRLKYMGLIFEEIGKDLDLKLPYHGTWVKNI